MSGSSSPEECVFCFEELSKWDVAVLNCPHRYHVDCIREWNNKSKNFSKVCPQCNVNGEIINIIKGKETRPEKVDKQTSNTYSQVNNTLQQNTYYDERFNMSDVSLLDDTEETTLPRRQPSRRRTIHDEIEPTLICCNIL